MNDIDVYTFLEHFGVRGMHWGVRKKEDKQAKRETKAKKYEDRAANIQKELDIAKANRYSHKGRPSRVKKLREEHQQALDDAERKRQGKLSSGQKKVVIGAAAAATIVAAYGTYSSINSGNARRLAEKGKLFVTKNQGLPWQKNSKLSDPNLDVDGIYTNVVRQINPEYGKLGTKMNCRRATYAYEMRRRGYDVQATRTVTGRGQEITGAYNALNPGVNLVPPGKLGMITRLFGETKKDSKPFTEELTKRTQSLAGEVSSTKIHKALNLYPDGARGELEMHWFGGGAHSMAWEKIKGQVVVFDTQNGKKYVGEEGIKGFSYLVDRAGHTRLDNLPLNNDFLMRWVKDA